MRIKRLLSLAALMLAAFSDLAFATTYTEAGDGDLSGDRTNPTTFTLTAGANSLTATTATNADEEYVKVVVPAGHTLQSIFLTSYSNANTKSFIGVQQGSAFTVTPAAATAADMYGYTHFGTGGTTALVGTDILDNMGAGAGAAGFTPPLGAGNYTFWIQEFGTVTYTLTFNVQASVEPPIMDPPGDAFLDSVDVSMTSATSGATIYYTTDGSTPTAANTPYTVPLHLTQTTTVKALAVKAGSNDSAITVETYTISPSPKAAPTPTLAVKGKKTFPVKTAKVKISGTSKNATSVTYTIKGVTKPAQGVATWHFTASLKPGRNVISILAKGAKKNSAPQKITVTYKKKK